MISKFLLSLCLLLSLAQAQTLRNKKDGGYEFTVVKSMEALPVDNQFKTSTCWSFSALSFFESELKRVGKPAANLSEMFVVRHTYAGKARHFVRMHGNSTFAPGAAFYDALKIFKEQGIVPEAAYAGKNYGETKHQHNELDAVLESMVKSLVKNPNGRLSTAWPKAIDGVLDAYLGPLPTQFEVEGKSYNPKSYFASLGINPDDYIHLGSYTHHPFYQPFSLEVPDNWTYSEVYNLPLDEFSEVMETAVRNGYTLAWAADVSEKGFSHKNGVAIVAEKEYAEMKKPELDSLFNRPIKQKTITQEIRQAAFDNYETQDDHGMHITGLVTDQEGTKYYMVKNSWGDDSNDCGGYLYVSEPYIRYKTTCVLVHKNALSSGLRKKLGLL
jgi:bleomycin hydrolase